MQLRKIANIQSGYLSRDKIEPDEAGSHLLLQARDVDAHRLTYRISTMVRFTPDISGKDWTLKPGDILFMARGARNYSVLLEELPDLVLAAGCFFIIRVTSSDVLPRYLWWYLNEKPVEHYLNRQSGRGVHMPVVTRSVLENVDIPLPTIRMQTKIIEVNTLMEKEQELRNILGQKRKRLATAACLRAARTSKPAV